MNLNNLENLKEEMKALGFKPALVEEMEKKMNSDVPEFKLFDTISATRGQVDLTVYFKQSTQSDYYYLNKFEVAHEKGKPLEDGQMYFVINKGPDGKDKAFSKYINVTEAINVFKGLKGNAELALGKKPTDAQRLVTMEQGKVTYVDKDFNRTYRTPPINQTFYVERGKGYTAEQAANLIQGRAVYRNDMVSTAGVQYKAWITLNFDKPKDRFNNFLLNQYSDPAYGFDLSKVLDKFDIKELADASKRESIDRSIRNGNRPIVTVKKDGEETKMFLETAPRYSQVNLYNLDGRSEKREQFMKPEKEIKLSVEKSEKKDKKQEMGLGV